MNTEKQQPTPQEGETHQSEQYEVHITGNVSGQIAVGHHIHQTYQPREQTSISSEELATLQALLKDLKTRVATDAPSELKDAALERINELEEAILTDEPDLTTMEYVMRWFAKRLPALAGTVASVVVHPIVGKLVEAAGDALADEFRRRFGGTSTP